MDSQASEGLRQSVTALLEDGLSSMHQLFCLDTLLSTLILRLEVHPERTHIQQSLCEQGYHVRSRTPKLTLLIPAVSKSSWKAFWESCPG